MTPGDAGVRAIVLYKSVKAGLELGLTLLLCILWPLGLPETLRALAHALRHHLAHAWALELADLLVESSTRQGLELTLVALALDGALTASEAWALHSRRRWAPWLVVAATGSLLPFELYEFTRGPRLSRALIFALNLAIAVYLARRAWRERRG